MLDWKKRTEDLRGSVDDSVDDVRSYFGGLWLSRTLGSLLAIYLLAALVGAIVGELPTGAVEGLGARMLIGSQFGEPLIMWSALFAAAILAGGLILIVGWIERLAKARMGVPA